MAISESQVFWEEAWARHLEQYLMLPPRTGYWIDQRLPLRGQSVLEIAGGSCRDSRFLAEKGINCIGSDFEEKTLRYLASRFKDSAFKLRQADGFSLPFKDNEFHTSFHNGFWVLFSDADIKRLAVEQARVTKKYMVILVHNKLNSRLACEFEEKSMTDELYRIRFFEPGELSAILNGTDIKIKSILIEKFGGPVDFLLYRGKWMESVGLSKHLLKRIVPKVYRFQPWNKVERIACVVELDK